MYEPLPPSYGQSRPTPSQYLGTFRNSQNITPIDVSPPYLTTAQPPMQVSDTANTTIKPEVPIDPLNSAYPIPWNWVLATYAEFGATQGQSSSPLTRFYRSPSLMSPDGQYAAYSRIKMQAEANLYGCRVTSVMFLENTKTGDLRTITAASPLSDNLFGGSEEAGNPGTISILIPVSWSKEGDRLLARQFEGLFNSSLASDYAVVWQRNDNQTFTLVPNTTQYTNAVLLGWSQAERDRVLFRAGNMGEEHWQMWAVNLTGETILARQDKPVVYGQVLNQVWTGPQGQNKI
ncbi:MAG: hypothetical protein SAJ12_05035 [Jaaginema sp. PMC 1079.18]|nr:hypothetical protein [Jaaginema sp. PMC 1080.18]MEC4850358.1 hypothetical protein [Jaaginema sp. PMC 1079.18]MEC4867156.1 hypothetical protein [Jaaginema sp. PMC 1078.18]